MQKISIAFDVDGTLITTDSAGTQQIVPNERIRTLLIALASMKNAKIIVCQVVVNYGLGKSYVLLTIQVSTKPADITKRIQDIKRNVSDLENNLNPEAPELGIMKYVDSIMAKNVLGKDENGHPIITANFTPDIAIDDIQACELGVLNLIVREK